PLWRQWYFAGGAPEGGLSSASGLSEAERTLLEPLYGAVSGQMDTDRLDAASPALLHASGQGGCTLAAASFRDSSAAYLVSGAVEESTGALNGPAYVLGGQRGVPHVLAYAPYGNPGDIRLL